MTYPGSENEDYTPPPSITVEEVATLSSSSDASSYSFFFTNFGSADADRYLLMALSARAGGSTLALSSATISGSPFSILYQQTYYSNGTDRGLISFSLIKLATGTSGTIVANMSRSAERAAGTLWKIVSKRPLVLLDSKSSLVGNASLSSGTQLSLNLIEKKGGASFSMFNGNYDNEPVVTFGGFTGTSGTISPDGFSRMATSFRTNSVNAASASKTASANRTTTENGGAFAGISIR